MTVKETNKQLEKTMELVKIMRNDSKLTDAGRSYYNGFYFGLKTARNLVSSGLEED